MPAGFLPTGPVEVYVRPRLYSTFLYLGTAVTCPKVSASIVYRPVASDRVDPGPYNKALCTEQHHLSMVLNRLNHRTWNRVKDGGSVVGAGEEVVRVIDAGKLAMGERDFDLYLRYSLIAPQQPGDILNPFVPAQPAVPEAAARGRLYFSAILTDYEEDYPDRLQEVGVLFECNPLPTGGKLKLYSEAAADFPQVTPE